MVKKLLLALILLCFFAVSPSYAVTPNEGIQFKPVPLPIPQPNRKPVEVPNKLIVTYQPNSSPQQLEKIISQQKKVMNTPLGYAAMQLKILFKQEKPLSFYTTSLQDIQDAAKKAHVIKSEFISISDKQIEKVTLRDGTNLNNALKIFKALNQVESVEKDYMYYTISGRIASEDTSLPVYVSNQYIIQYAPGQSPQELETKVNAQKTASSSILGSVRIAVEETVSSLTGATTPEKSLNQVNKVENSVGQQKEVPLLTETRSVPPSLQNIFVVTTDGTTTISETLQKYESLPGIISVEPDRYMYTNAVPNDTYYNKQWAYPKIQAPTAWDTTKGSDNIIVAVIDTGAAYNHPDLIGRVIKGPDFIDGDSDPMDDCWHGTHVAGIVGALTNNTVGVSGVNWDGKVMALRALKRLGVKSNGEPICGGEGSAPIDAIMYAANNGANVINMSLGGPGPCPPIYQNAINYARSKGVTVVTAAGNDNINASNNAPGNCQGVINVGATGGPSDTRASYSNFGSSVAMSAPGGGEPCETNCIYSTFVNGTQYGYNMAGGTSQAAPFVAGAAALYLSTHTGASPDEVKNALVSSADPISTDKPIGPRLNLAKLLGSAGGTTPTPSPTLTASPTLTSTPGGSTPTPTPSPALGASPTPALGASPTPTLTASPTIANPNNTTFVAKVVLPGIGNGPGDNSSPKNSPRPVRIDFIDTTGNNSTTKTGSLAYNNGTYSGPLSKPSAGTYQVRITFDNTLKKLLPGFFVIGDSPLTLPTIQLIPGDINQDGILDILDYNILLSCIQGSCSTKNLADLNDDGMVDAKDMNILLRQFADRSGN